MAKEFIVDAPNPEVTFPQIQRWAAANGFQLNGSASAGNFRGKPGGIEGMLIGEIIGNYTVSGGRATILVNKDLPAGIVGERLSRFGLRLIGSR